MIANLLLKTTFALQYCLCTFHAILNNAYGMEKCLLAIMWCLDHQTGRGQALSHLGVNRFGAGIKVISGLAKSYFNRTPVQQHFCNQQKTVFVQKMASESHRNIVTDAVESGFIEGS